MSAPQHPQPAASPWLTGADAIAGYAGEGTHPKTVEKAMRAGELAAHQFSKGGTWRARPEDVDAWIEGKAARRTRLRSVGR